MRYIKYLLVIIIIISVNIGVVYAAPALEDDEFPEYIWYFDLDGKLKYNGEIESRGVMEHVFKDLLNIKRTQVVDQLRLSFKSGLKDKSVVDNSLLERDYNNKDMKGGRNLWLQGLEDIVSFDSYIIGMRIGANDFNIYVPKGKREVWDEEEEEYKIEYINEDYVNAAYSGFLWFQISVKEAILAVGVEKGFNVYTGFSKEKQLHIGTGSTGIMVKDDKSSGYIFGGVGSGDISYTLDYFYSPLFGKIPGEVVPKNTSGWNGRLNDILFDYNIIDKELYVIFDESYLKFADEKSEVRRSIRRVADKTALDKDFDTEFVIRDTSFKASDLVDYNMRVITPSKFMLMVNGRYGLSEDGFLLLNKIRISLFDNKVYLELDDSDDSDDSDDENAGGEDVGGEDAGGENGENDDEVIGESGEINKDEKFGFKDLGSTIDFSDLTGENLFLYHYKIGGKYVGAVIPLRYREAIIDHTKSPASVYITGRNVIFNNEYNGNLSFDSSNLGMMDIEESLSGKTGAIVRDFAFEWGSNAMNSDCHKKLTGASTNTFMFDYSFKLTDSEEMSKGFVIYRNNMFLEDVSLIQWLETDTAQSVIGSKAEELVERITGVFGIEKKELSYDEWLRMQDIREDLDRQNKDVLVNYIKVISLVFAVFLIIYSLFMILAYFIDIFNPFTDIALLNIMTFGKMYPIVSGQEADYAMKVKGDLKYVTFIDVFKFSMFGCFLGCLFLTYSPILKLFYNIYVYLIKLLGGI